MATQLDSRTADAPDAEGEVECTSCGKLYPDGELYNDATGNYAGAGICDPCAAQPKVRPTMPRADTVRASETRDDEPRPEPSRTHTSAARQNGDGTSSAPTVASESLQTNSPNSEPRR